MIIDDPDDILKILKHNETSLPFEDPEVLSRDGAFSVVFRARLKEPVIPIALKVDTASDAYRQKCFHREAQILEYLHDVANVAELMLPLGDSSLRVSAAGFEFQAKIRYFGLRLYPNTLLRYIRGEVGILERLRRFREVAKGLNSIHRAGIVHRDVKPNNCFLDDRSLYIGDFGCARRLADRDLLELDDYHEFVKGDRRYTPIDLMITRDAKYDQRAIDVYSLGCVLYEVITGKIFIDDLPKLIAAVDDCRSRVQQERKRNLSLIADALETAGMVPQVDSLSGLKRNEIDLINQLLSELCCPDPKKRVVDFDRIFRRIDVIINTVKGG